jgi:trafficking protein particle complex subunit 1
MGVHSLHIFDRKGKTLFTKRYAKNNNESPDDEQLLSEQRKLVFGMVYSLKDIARSLSPAPKPLPTQRTGPVTANNNNAATPTVDSGLHTVQTGASTLHVYETASGLRFCLYTDPLVNNSADPTLRKKIRAALHHAYQQVWIQCVTRSPLYHPTQPNVKETNFEATLDEFLEAQPWFA